MKYIFFDTETTGLPLNYKAAITNLDNWPRLVQLAWILYDKDGNIEESSNSIIKPDGYTIPLEASNIHGITTERAEKEGKPLIDVLYHFQNNVWTSNCSVAHNMDFDEKIVGAECYRLDIKNYIYGRKKICTMKSTTEYCAIPHYYGYKWPKLQELHYKLFGCEFEEAHNAAVDIQITAKCFWELKRRGIIPK